MHDAATITLIILTVAWLRRSLLTDPDADGGVRNGGGPYGSKVVPASVKTGSPHPVGARRRR